MRPATTPVKRTARHQLVQYRRSVTSERASLANGVLLRQSSLLLQPGRQGFHPWFREGRVGILAVEPERRIDQRRSIEEGTPGARDQNVAVEQVIDDG